MKQRTLIEINKQPIPDSNIEIRLYCVIRNELPRMGFFLKYYKKIGIDRFFFIDNGSTDKVEQTLSQFSNVHLFHSTLKYYQTKAVHLKKLVNTYSKNSWCLIVDADEFFRFPFDSILKLSGLISYLEKTKTYAFKALLLDMYSDKTIIQTQYLQSENPFDICQYFDREGYVKRDEQSYGGVRARVFGLQKVLLTKYPLFKNDPSLHQKFTNFHLNPGINNTKTTGVIFHFKFFDSFIKKTKEAVKIEQYWQNSREYKFYIKKDLTKLQLYSEAQSVRFKNLLQLYQLKLIHVNLFFLFFVCRWRFKKLNQ